MGPLLVDVIQDLRAFFCICAFPPGSSWCPLFSWSFLDADPIVHAGKRFYDRVADTGFPALDDPLICFGPRKSSFTIFFSYPLSPLFERRRTSYPSAFLSSLGWAVRFFLSATTNSDEDATEKASPGPSLVFSGYSIEAGLSLPLPKKRLMSNSRGTFFSQGKSAR